MLFLAALIFATIVFLFPFIWLVSASLKTRQDVFANELFKFPLHFENYLTVFEIAPVASWFVNSVIVGLLAVGMALALDLLVLIGQRFLTPWMRVRSG